MVSKSLGSAGVYTLQHTPSGSPYIAIPSRSPTPIYLTPYFASDVPAVHAVVALPSVNPHLVSAPQPYTLADAEWWVTTQLTTATNLALQVLRSGAPKEGGTLVGSVSLMPPNSGTLARLRKANATTVKNHFELGYYLHPDFRGRGIVKAGVKAALAWAEAECGARCVAVMILEDNLASRRVIEGLGEEYFVKEEGEDEWVDWPENKGGGRRKLLVWKWKAS